MKIFIYSFFRMKMCRFLSLTVFISFPFYKSFAQECESTLIILLKNSKGGIYANQKVTLTNKSGGKVFTQTSDGKGEANFKLPCGATFDLTVSNYSRKKDMQSPPENGSGMVRTLTYEPDMLEKEKAMAMNADEKKALDAAVAGTPDTVFVRGSEMPEPTVKNNFIALSINLKDVDGNPLPDEVIKFIGKKRGKSVKGTTDKNGRLFIYLPKGDEYTLNFIWNKNFLTNDVPYSKGTSTSALTVGYLGTKEIARRKKEEAERIAAEEKRLKEEKLAFEKKCKTMKISVEEGHKREALGTFYEDMRNAEGKVAAVVLNRNNWSEKLIVCDLTGSMMPYTSQLALWFKLNTAKEKNLQMVFFNDGDNKSDAEKKIGETGGIYYTKASTYEKLAEFMAKVASAGGGGDCPENNMEALIKGTSMAAPYKELVMVVDNNAPVKDISLLSKFDKPVHIILCGSYDGHVLEDYLNIALKTKGTIHTIEEDIVKIAGMMEGQEIKIGNQTYRIMGGEFVRVTKA